MKSTGSCAYSIARQPCSSAADHNLRQELYAVRAAVHDDCEATNPGGTCITLQVGLVPFFFETLFTMHLNEIS